MVPALSSLLAFMSLSGAAGEGGAPDSGPQPRSVRRGVETEDGPKGSPSGPGSETGTPSAPPAEDARPSWRLTEALSAPTWLRLGATHRTRYEHLWNAFRAGTPGRDAALSLRTTLWAELRWTPFVVGLELMDSRLYGWDSNTPLNTTLVNTLEPLQAYIGATWSDVLAPDASAQLRMGRLTLDVGSRRFVARNRYRNTINSFTGFDLDWKGPHGHRGRLLVTLPVERRPFELSALRNNAVSLDRESLDTIFLGAFYASPLAGWRVGLEVFVFGLYERTAATRRLLTPGIRLIQPASAGALDFELEGALQVGRSRAAPASSEQDLDHLAGFAHLSVGYTFRAEWAPRLVLQYDYASGDGDPEDGQNGRFDTLFGGRRFELGPTGIYGALPRSNIQTPGVRVEVRPHPSVNILGAYRAAWLAEARDAWTTSGLRDVSGASGSFIGQQVEARVRWSLLPGNIRFEMGIAHLFLGEFAVSAPNTNGDRSPTIIYSQLGFEI